MDPSNIVSLAETEGRQGVDRWVGARMHLFRSDPQIPESLYSGLAEQSSGAALLFAVVLQKRGLLSARLTADLQKAKDPNPHLWVSGICHVSMPHVLGKVREALERGDLLFGWHSFYCAGTGPANVLFTAFRDFQATLDGAAPGDRFQLTSLHQLTARGGILEPTLAAARRYLARARQGEVWVLRSGIQPPAIEILWADNADDLAAESWFRPSEGLYLARLREDLEFDDEYFVDAKKADARGFVPLGGTY